ATDGTGRFFHVADDTAAKAGGPFGPHAEHPDPGGTGIAGDFSDGGRNGARPEIERRNQSRSGGAHRALRRTMTRPSKRASTSATFHWRLATSASTAAVPWMS